MAQRRRLADRIVDTAIEIAEDVGWDNLRLRLVAERLDISLAGVHQHYRDLDAVADAWFRRAWAAMLAAPPKGLAALPAKDRIHLVMMRWFDALSPHRRVSGEMVSTKIYLSHPHHWGPLVFNLSRTIQWVRDAAMLDAGGRRRQVEEIGLTLLFVATLRFWLRDDSANHERTREFLARRLDEADRAMGGLWPPRGRRHEGART